METIGTKTLGELAGVSEVRLHHIRKRGENGAPFEYREGKYHYPLGAALRWVLDREMSRQLWSCVKRIENLEAELALLKAVTSETTAADPQETSRKAGESQATRFADQEGS